MTEEKKKDTLGVKLYAFFEDIASTVLWFLIFNNAVFHMRKVSNFIDNIFLNPYYLALRPFRWLILFFLVVILRIIFGKKKTFQYLVLFTAHFIFFPIILFFQFFFYFLPSILKFANKIYRFFYKYIFEVTQKSSMQVFLFFIAIICFYVIVSSANSLSIKFSIIFLLTILSLHLLYLLVWTNNPYLMLSNFCGIIEDVWSVLIKKERIEKQYLNKKNEIKDINKEKEGLRDIIKFSAKLFNWLKTKMDVLTHRRLLIRWFIIIFALSVLFTVIIYSFIYFGITKIDEMNFLGVNKELYFEHLYYSISIFSSIDSTGIVPCTRIAKIFVIFEILTGMFLLIILITSFSTMTVEIARDHREKLLDRVQDKLKWLDEFSKSELGINLETILLKKEETKQLTGTKQ